MNDCLWIISCVQSDKNAFDKEVKTRMMNVKHDFNITFSV